MGWDDVSALATGMVILGAALAALAKWVIFPAARAVQQVARFLSDWEGEGARPGVPGRNGVMPRLESIEYKVGRAEFHLGNGNPTAMRDVVEVHGEQLSAIDERLAALEVQQAVATVNHD